MKMNVKELEEKIVEKKLDHNAICIGKDGNYDERFNLLEREDGKWETFYGEHGQKTNTVVYDTEEEACDAFWEMIKDVVLRDPFPKWFQKLLNRIARGRK